MSESIWTFREINRIWDADINGNEYEVYETAPGMQRVRRNGRLIAETYTIEEGKRWAETYDHWLIQEAPKLPERPSKLPEFTDISKIMEEMDAIEGGWQQFPRYPQEFV